MKHKPLIKHDKRISTLAKEGAPVGRYANPRHAGPTKMEKRLAVRIKDFEGLSSKEAGVSKRRASGGFHCPGSLQ